MVNAEHLVIAIFLAITSFSVIYQAKTAVYDKLSSGFVKTGWFNLMFLALLLLVFHVAVAMGDGKLPDLWGKQEEIRWR